MLGQLFDILPVLALVGLGLTGIENATAALASHARPRADHHRHLATRNRVSNNIGAQAKRAGQGVSSPAGGLIRRQDGKKCRVRGQTAVVAPVAQASTVSTVLSTTVVPVAPTSTAEPAPTPSQAAVEQAAPAPPPAEPSPSPSPAIAADNNWSQPQPSPEANHGISVDVSVNLGGGNWGGSKNVGSKLGHAWPNGDWAQANDPNNVGNYIGSKASWYYTWSPFSVGSADRNGLEFVPMLWGPKQLGDWYAQQANWPSSVKNALFFNEPNEHSQCNMAAGDSVGHWMNEMVPLRQRGIALGGAAVTNAPSGLQWVHDIQTLCTQYGNSASDCKPDFYPVHWYDVTVEGFQQYVEKFHQETGIDIWITEYACQNFNGGAQCSEGQVWDLHQRMAAWFDSKDWIKRYSPFGVMQNMQGVNQMNALMSPSGHITDLGNWYIWNA